MVVGYLKWLYKEIPIVLRQMGRRRRPDRSGRLYGPGYFINLVFAPGIASDAGKKRNARRRIARPDAHFLSSG